MKTIHTTTIIDAVAQMCVSANCHLNDDIRCSLEHAAEHETNVLGKDLLGDIIKNAHIARERNMPICQDTGMSVFFVSVGQEVYIDGGSLTDAINEGVRRGYADGYLRKSVVGDPLNRKNTGDNTPAVIYYDIVPGDKLRIDFAPKGFGSENMSALAMLKPSDGIDGVIDFVVNTVAKAGPNPCPPIVVGVGIGGTMDKAANMSKHALLRPVGSCNPNEYYAKLEHTMLERINALDIGVQGFGGNTTALGVNVEYFPTHIAGLPVAVNINCHVTRHASLEL